MKINFLIADEIRPEANGKQTVLGLYADSTIILEKSPAQPNPSDEIQRGIERLAILFNVADIDEKNHNYLAELISPKGTTNGAPINLGQAKVNKGASRTMVIEMKPFLFEDFGTYILRLHIDNKHYDFPIHLVEATTKSES